MSLNKNDQPGSFFDKNTLLAMVLAFCMFFLWQNYMAKKYPPAKPTAVTEKTETKTETSTPNGTTAATTAPADASVAATGPAAEKNPTAIAPTKEELVHYESDVVSFDVSSVGMALKNIKLNKFSDRRGDAISYVTDGASSLMATTVNGLQNYKITRTGDNQFQGVATGNGLTVTKTLNIEPTKYLVSVKVDTKATEKTKLTVETFLVGKVEAVSKNFLLPSYEHQEFFVKSNDKNERTTLSPETDVKNDYLNVSLASFNSHYFSLVLANRTQDILPSASAKVTKADGNLDLKYETAQPVDAQVFDFDFYFGPKDMEILKSVDESFKDVIDYGFFSFIGRPLLWLLKFIHNLINNWGVSIILLTIVVRVVLLPMNLYSFKAMRKMQKVQPLLKEIKEKYKNDPARVNQETLAIMKREKANPLSGCLPALAQIPIFFALYSVLGKSIELYKQPFFFWIQDLSLKDPFFILPILVGATFFVQQKITPAASMDPAQQKVLMFMPLIFSLFMLTTPSGLTLYMFVNGLFGVCQQYFFTKQRDTVGGI